MFRYVVIVWAMLAAGLAVFAGYSFFRKKSPEEKIEALRREVAPSGAVIFQAQLGGKQVSFLPKNCEVFVLDPTQDKVKRTKVLKPGFYLGFTACTDQSIKEEGGYVVAYLANRAIGAGGGNTSGGTYRTKDGFKWEKKFGGKWLPVEEAQA